MTRVYEWSICLRHSRHVSNPAGEHVLSHRITFLDILTYHCGMNARSCGSQMGASGTNAEVDVMHCVTQDVEPERGATVSNPPILSVSMLFLEHYTVKETVPAVTRTPVGSDGSLPSCSTKFELMIGEVRWTSRSSQIPTDVM